MDVTTVLLLVFLAASVSSTACLLGVLMSRRQSSNIPTTTYPVQEEKTPPKADPVLKEDAAVYDIADKRSEEMVERFKSIMAEKKPYLDTKVSIEKIAAGMNTNKSTLSKLINDKFGMNFRQLMNSYRVKEAMEIFARNNDISMEELKKASGFKSISTFTSSFSRFTGCTPGEYCKKVSGK